MTKYILLIITFILLFFKISFCEIVITTTLGTAGDVSLVKARAAIEGYLEEASKELGEEVVFKFPEKGETTVSSYLKGKADIISTSALNYVELTDKKVPLVLVAKFKKSGKDYMQGGVFVRKDSGIKSIKDLKGKKIATGTPFSEKNSDERIFIKMLFKKEGIKEEPEKFFGEIVVIEKVASAAMALIFGEIDAAILDVVTIDTMAKIKKRYEEIMPIAVSGKYPWGALICNPKLGKEKIEKLKKILFNAHKTPKGRQFLFAVQFEEAVPAKDEDYEEMRGLWKEFHD